MNTKKTFKALIKITLFFSLLGGIAFLGLLLYYSKDLPQPEKFTERRIAQPTKIYDRTGNALLYTIFGEEKREVVSLSEISPYLQQAVIAAEDKRFRNHIGIDPKRILKAILIDIQVGRRAQGASTIPQQLIRSTFLTTHKTVERKIGEIILSIELDMRYSKDQILEWYLNQVPFGSNAYGIEAASQTFFSKQAKDVDIAEAAVLAALIQAPSRLSPYGENIESLLARKDYVLEQMLEQEFITEEEAEAARKQEVHFEKLSAPIKAPHFVLQVKKELIEKYGEDRLKTSGFKVYTTLNIEFQEQVEEIVKKHAKRNEGLQCFNAALTAIDPRTGGILALVGSADYFAEPFPKGCRPGKNCLFEPKFDVASLGERQPGSSFKPIVYAAAFENGYDDEHIVVDEETDFGIWGGKSYIPQNYDGRFRGPVTLREALAQSLNIPAVKVLVYLAGLEESVVQAKKMGISTLRDPSSYGPSLVLGGAEVNLIDMVSAYSVFATNGLRNTPHMIMKIEDKKGSVVDQFNEDSKRALSSSSAEMITDVLSDNEARSPMFGTNSNLYIEGYSIAAKTGTTQNFKDAWIIGYSPKIVIGVWAGNNNNTPTSKRPGVTLAGPIWKESMIKALEEGWY